MRVINLLLNLYARKRASSIYQIYIGFQVTNLKLKKSLRETQEGYRDSECILARVILENGCYQANPHSFTVSEDELSLTPLWEKDWLI